MSDAEATPATFGDFLDDLHAEDEAEAEAENLTEKNAKADATEKALLMANDFNIDLEEVQGTGKDGRITVPDVDKVRKAKLAAMEEEAQEMAEKAEASGDEMPEDAESTKPHDTEQVVTEAKQEAEPPVKRKKLSRNGAGISRLLPTLRENLLEIRHIKRTLNRYGTGWENEIVSGDQADEKIGQYLVEEGYQVIHMQSLGLSPDGLQFMWILGKPDPRVEVEHQYKEIYHILQNVGGIGADGQGLAGFQADQLINSYLVEGWDLAFSHAVSVTQQGINMLWVLMR